MSETFFDSRTPRFSLPLLFAGQTQKEGFVNEIAARLDALVHLVVEGAAATPPADPADGQNWLVSDDSGGAWSGRSGEIAARQSGNWLFIEPRTGMKLFNKAAGQEMYFHGTWKAADRPSSPQGGTIVDSESRTAIAAIIAALTTAGIVARA